MGLCFTRLQHIPTAHQITPISRLKGKRNGRLPQHIDLSSDAVATLSGGLPDVTDLRLMSVTDSEPLHFQARLRQICGLAALCPQLSLRRLFEISQIGWWLVLLGRHQEAVCPQDVGLLADGDQPRAFDAIALNPVAERVWVQDVFLVHSPWSRQSMIYHGYFVVKDIRVPPVAVHPFFENGLIVEMQRKPGSIVDARPLETAGLDFEQTRSLRKPILRG